LNHGPGHRGREARNESRWALFSSGDSDNRPGLGFNMAFKPRGCDLGAVRNACT